MEEYMVRRFLLGMLCLLTVLTLVVSGCGSTTSNKNESSSAQGNQLVITDSVGRKITLNGAVSRAVIVNAYNAELINAIGAMDQVVGVDYYIYQDQEGFKHRFTKDMLIGQSKGSDLNYEKIIELKPQAVILTSNYDWQDAEKKLKPFGIEVINVDSYYTDKFADNVRLLGKIFGKENNAKEFSDYFMSKLDYIDKQLANVPRRSVYYEYRTAGRTTVPGDYFYEMVNLAHGDNIFKDAKNNTVDIESVVEKNPKYIVKVSDANVYSSYVPPTEAEHKHIFKEIAARPGWDQIEAVKNKKVLLLSHYVHGGASKLVGTMYIAKFLYPEYLPDLHPENVFQDWLTKYQHLDYIAGHTYPAYKLGE